MTKTSLGAASYWDLCNVDMYPWPDENSPRGQAPSQKICSSNTTTTTARHPYGKSVPACAAIEGLCRPHQSSLRKRNLLGQYWLLSPWCPSDGIRLAVCCPPPLFFNWRNHKTYTNPPTHLRIHTTNSACFAKQHTFLHSDNPHSLSVSQVCRVCYISSPLIKAIALVLRPLHQSTPPDITFQHGCHHCHQLTEVDRVPVVCDRWRPSPFTNRVALCTRLQW